MSKVKNIEYVGVDDTYDLELDHPDHQFFLSNGILTSNSHALSYSIISYQTAYLKHYYPTEYMCALLVSKDPNEDKTQTYLSECDRLGIKILPPDVNLSKTNYDVAKEKVIVTGFVPVKGLGDAVINSIICNQPYKDFCDFIIKNTKFCIEGEIDNEYSFEEFIKKYTLSIFEKKKRTKKTEKQEDDLSYFVSSSTKKPKIKGTPAISKGSIEALAGSGCFDCFGLSRKYIFENFAEIIKLVNNNLKLGVKTCDSELNASNESWSKDKTLFMEREYLGRPISGDTWEIFPEFFKSKQIAFCFENLSKQNPGDMVRVEAIIKSKIKEFKVKKPGKNFGKKFAKYSIEDLNGNISELTVWMDDYEQYGKFLVDGYPFKGLCKVDEYMSNKSLSLYKFIEIYGYEKNISKVK